MDSQQSKKVPESHRNSKYISGFNFTSNKICFHNICLYLPKISIQCCLCVPVTNFSSFMVPKFLKTSIRL
uniref:Ovule protein n=1 Tax=Panagrolaimus sp. PS1159 TaxID=55785 RepID=A0AC35FJ09_9BILA